MKSVKIEKNIEPILKVTKDVIKADNCFNNYYLHENNSLYQNQLPLLTLRSSIREAKLLKKEKKNMPLLTEPKDLVIKEEKNEEQKMEYSKQLLSKIRKLKFRSKKLPPLCPFYNEKGELIREVVSTSKINSKNSIKSDGYNNLVLTTMSNSYSKRPFGYLSPENKIKLDKIYIKKNIDIDFEEFQKEIFNQSNYDLLKYDYSEIFGHKAFYQEMLVGLVEEIKILTEEGESKLNMEEKQKQKIFEWGKDKIKLLLSLKSLSIRIQEIEKDGNLSEDKFQYTLPIQLLPLFYYKGVEEFLLFIISFMKWNDNSNQFELEQDIPKIINMLLSNCKDLKLTNDEDSNVLDEIALTQSMDYRKNLNQKLALSKLEKKSSKNVAKANVNILSQTMNYGIGGPQGNQVIFGTTVENKKLEEKHKFNIYPKENKLSDYNSYNVFEYYWKVPGKIFLLTIETPLITFSIPSYFNKIQQYINYELLLYLFKINFDSWDYYIIKYLSSIKSFRIFLSKISSIVPKMNINLHLEKPNIKQFDNSNYEMVNIITSEVNISRRGNEEKKEFRSMDKLEKIEENKDEKLENDETLDNPPVKNDKVESNHVLTEETVLPPANINNTNEEKNNVIVKKNSVLKQKCFMAIISLTKPEKMLTNEYIIHFNYYHFTKFEFMEKYMSNIQFLLKFIDINYDNLTLKFDYESLNFFDEKNWLKEIKKYNLCLEEEKSVDCEKLGASLNNQDNKIELKDKEKNIFINIEIKRPSLHGKNIHENGYLNNSVYNITDKDKKKVRNDKNIVKLLSNVCNIFIQYQHNGNFVGKRKTDKFHTIINNFKKNNY